MGRIATDMATRSKEQMIMHRKESAKSLHASGGTGSSSSSVLGEGKDEAYSREDGTMEKDA
jgi:hypothetical protein